MGHQVGTRAGSFDYRFVIWIIESTTQSYLEHTNITVSNPQKLAEILSELFDWHIRWSGESMDQGYTVHVGSNDSYLALYGNDRVKQKDERDHSVLDNLNHVAVVVPDLDKVLEKVKAKAIEPFNFADYDPGKRFYFFADQGLEVEVVSYSE